jgi:hypothetical protein
MDEVKTVYVVLVKTGFSDYKESATQYPNYGAAEFAVRTQFSSQDCVIQPKTVTVNSNVGGKGNFLGGLLLMLTFVAVYKGCIHETKVHPAHKTTVHQSK